MVLPEADSLMSPMHGSMAALKLQGMGADYSPWGPWGPCSEPCDTGITPSHQKIPLK